MAEGVRGDAGGIAGLLTLHREHREAVEYDLIALGLRWRDFPGERTSWADLLVICKQAPQTSALYRAVDPDWRWGLREQLLAAAVDALNGANWQRGQGREQDRPKPIPRPGVEPDAKQFGRGALPVDEMADWLGWEHQMTGG